MLICSLNLSVSNENRFRIINFFWNQRSLKHQRLIMSLAHRSKDDAEIVINSALTCLVHLQ